MCLIVVGGPWPPSVFCFLLFQNARPPATPRRLGPPLTQRSKTLGPTSLAHAQSPFLPLALARAWMRRSSDEECRIPRRKQTAPNRHVGRKYNAHALSH